MSDPTQSGLLDQEKIIESISLVKNRLKTLNSAVEKIEPADFTQSVQSILSEIYDIEAEVDYFFELSNCKHLMMLDQVAYIKKLESELSELKLQK